MRRKIISIVGARPQFIKACAISRRLRKGGYPLEEVIVHTGQHYDDSLSKRILDELEIYEPHYNLGIGSHSHGKQVGLMIAALEELLVREKPFFVIVYGDTNSTLAGALSAAKLNLPLGHVEAGLRCHNRRVPEEINRIVVDHCSDHFFCPTRTAVENLHHENIHHGICFSGDVMYEMVRLFTGHAEKMSDIMSRLSLVPKGYSLATVHRAENTDNLQNLRSIFEAFVQIGDVIVPLRPRTRKAIESEYPHFLKMVRILDPVTYFDFLVLEKNARLTLTDSGGVQKEAYFHGVPCVTLRQETEWPETLENGHNVLVGADTAEIIQATRTQSRKQLDPAGHDIFGDGSSSQEIVEYICALA